MPIALVLGLVGCAPVEPSDRIPDPQASAASAMQAAMQSRPPEEPLPLPPLRPESRLQSELTALSPAEIARWILPPAEAGRIVGSELLRGMTPRVNGISLYEAPVATARPGVCRIAGYDVWLRVPNESALTYAQHLDPPLQPYLFQPLRRWKVIGSTLDAHRRGPPDCAAALPYGDWFEAPSEDVLHRAASAVERAQRGESRPQLHCRQMRYEEARQDFGYPACPDPRALLGRLTPDLIKRVRAADCEIGTEPGGCLGIEYHDPAAPGTHSIYVVTIPDVARPAYIRIVQTMLPPH